MAVSVEWDNPEKTVLRYDLDTDWNIEEFYSAKVLGDAMIQGVGDLKQVALLLVLPDRVHLPPNVVSIACNVLKGRQDEPIA